MVNEHGLKISENLVKEIVKLFLVTKKFFNPNAMKESYLKYFPDTPIPKPKSPPPEQELVTEEKKGKKGKRNSKSRKVIITMTFFEQTED